MSKTRHLAQESQAADKPPNRRWIQITIVAGVALLVVVILLFKNQAAGPSAVSLADLQMVTGEGGDGTTTEPGELPQQRWERLLAAGQPTFAFFHSNNCVQCIKMMEVVEQVYPEFDDSVALVDVDVYDKANSQLLQRAQIRAIPTQIFFDRTGQGQVIMGAMMPDQFREQMRALAGGE